MAIAALLVALSEAVPWCYYAGFHSGIFCLGDAINAGYKFVPAAKLRSENFAALARQTIVTAALPA